MDAMSATNRGAKRNKADFYATPEGAFKPLLAHLPRRVIYWEPAQGDGRLVRWLRESGRRAYGTDLNVGRDFLKSEARRQFIITNPPFSLAREFIDHARALAPEVMMLLRLNFLGAEMRREWWIANEPAAIFVLSQRPKFGKNKHGKLSSDATEYGWFYWGTRFSGIRHFK